MSSLERQMFLTCLAVWIIALLNLVNYMGLMNVNQSIIHCLNCSKRKQAISLLINQVSFCEKVQ